MIAVEPHAADCVSRAMDIRKLAVMEPDVAKDEVFEVLTDEEAMTLLLLRRGILA